MPFIGTSDTLLTRRANAVLAHAFLPRAKDWLYPRLAGSVISTSEVEPYPVLGSVPGLAKVGPGIKETPIQDYVQNIPNQLFRNIVSVRQSTMEFDQTRATLHLANQVGLRLSEFPDQLWAARLLLGSTNSAASEVFNGASYNLTLDSKSYFRTDHDTGPQAQSNQIEGNLPVTIAALNAQDAAQSAKQMQRDLNAVVDRIRTVKDDSNLPIYPTIDMRRNIVVVVPPALEVIATLAFRTDATAVIDQTTNVSPLFVKDVVTSGYLAGLPNPLDELKAEIKPVNETDWYVLVVDDYIKPFYMQLFRPIADGEIIGVNDPVTKVMQANGSMNVDQATLFASTRIDTTFKKIGENSDYETMRSERFYAGARWRGNSFYGPWFTGYRVYPTGGTVEN